MKKLYPIAFLSIIIFSSCGKLNPDRKIVGTWKLDDVVKRKFLSNTHQLTGFESGLFSFYSNGNATYADSQDTLYGSWNMRYEDRSYYDGDGNYQNKNNLTLWLRLSKFNSNRYIDWYFDDSQFKRSSDRLDGFIYTGFAEYQYSFRRQ